MNKPLHLVFQFFLNEVVSAREFSLCKKKKKRKMQVEIRISSVPVDDCWRKLTKAGIHSGSIKWSKGLKNV